MKIGPNDDIVRQVYSQSSQKANGAPDGEFGEALSQAIDGAQSKHTGAVPISGGCRPAEIVFNPITVGRESALVNRVDDLLNVLDEYRQKLGDHQVSLKEIYPLVNRMEADQESLMPAFNSLSDEDGLKDILNQTLMTTSLEVIRFNRGDYIAA